MKTKINKNIINLTLIIVMFVALFSYMVIVDGWANIVIIVRRIEPIWFAFARFATTNLLDIRISSTSYSY